MATLKTDKPVDTSKQQVACPNCHRRGHVRARKDAYADHTITMNGHFQYSDTTIFDDVQAYECFACQTELPKEQIEQHNNMTIL